jgi:hypothetical protein
VSNPLASQNDEHQRSEAINNHTKKAPTTMAKDNTAMTRKFTFEVYDVQRKSDEDNSIHDLMIAGCTQIEIIDRNHSDQTITVRCVLPVGIDSVRELSGKLHYCSLAKP